MPTPSLNNNFSSIFKACYKMGYFDDIDVIKNEPAKIFLERQYSLLKLL